MDKKLNNNKERMFIIVPFINVIKQNYNS